MKAEGDERDDAKKEDPADDSATDFAFPRFRNKTFGGASLGFHPSGPFVFPGKRDAVGRNPFPLRFNDLAKGIAAKGNIRSNSLAEH